MLAVSVPKIRADSPRTTELRPRRVEAWLEGLADQEPQAAAEAMRQALFTQNRVALEEGNRLRLLELFQKPVGDIASQLQSVYVSSPLPMTGGHRAIFDVVQSLLQEVAYGYKIVASDLIGGGRAVSKQADVVLAIQRAVFYLSRELLNCYQVYESPPAGIWRELHQLYKYAEEHNLLTQPVAVPDDKEAGSHEGLMSIHDAYQQMLITGACNPFGLVAGEVIQVYHMAARWHSLAHISKHLEESEPAGCFLVSLISDQPPVPLLKATTRSNAEYMRMLRLVDVVKEIHRATKTIARHGAVSSEFISHADSSQVPFLKRAGKTLGAVRTRRKLSRVHRDHDVEICVGINAVHYYASGEKHFSPPGREEPQPTTTPVPNAIVEEYIDLSDPRLVDRAAQHPDDIRATAGTAGSDRNWTRSAIYRLYTCRAKDESASGLRILVSAPAEVRLRVGDPVGLRFPTPDRWRVAAVRWIRGDSGESIQAGLELLAPDMKTIAVKWRSNGSGNGQYLQALYLPENRILGLPESVIAPAGTFRGEGKLLIHEGDDEAVRTESAFKMLERTGSYDRYAVDATAEENDSDR